MVFKLDDPLTHGTAVELARLLERGEVSSEEIVRAHLDRIITLDGRVNAFVELLRGEALESAARIDRRRRSGEALGPLAGLPISIKENLDMTGRASTLGIVARRHQLSRSDAGMVRAVRDADGVIIGRTNVPQLLLSHETRNPVFGVTNNAHSAKHAPGGSSGGEASALACGFSVLGVGTDIGGSIRVPAHFSGIAGLKPTLDRWSNRGSNGALVGQEVVRSQTGPMARTAADVAFLFRALDPVRMASFDPLVPPLPVRDPHAIDPRTLRVGFYVDDGLIMPGAAVTRAVHQAAKWLEGAGVSVVPFTPPLPRDAVAVYLAALGSDAGHTAFRQLAGTALESTLAPLKQAASLPSPIRSTLIRALRALGEERAAWLLAQGGEKPVHELWRLTKLARDYRLTLCDAMAKAQVDVLLCPAHATAAVPHTLGGQFLLAGSSSMLFNLVQFPAGVLPVTRVSPSETERHALPNDRFERIAVQVEAQSEGLPIGVQVVSTPFRDEEVLAVMLLLERARPADAVPSTPRAPT